MKVKQKYRETLRTLNTFERHLRKQTNTLGQIRRAVLSGSDGIEFHVRFADGSSHKTSMAKAPTINEAFREAARRWDELNPCANLERNRAEVFLAFNDRVIALAPKDAARVASKENGRRFQPDQFRVDPRLININSGIVWPVDQVFIANP
ncbi:hypothetical protein KGQ31_01105 [Patescibacteria group bacterium]|nr:hypothetical protein [Patescibacteria group bacterium]